MKTIKFLHVLLALYLMIFTTGCLDDFFIEGNGIVESEGRITNDFLKVTSNGDYVVHITHGNNYDVVVNAEYNLLPYIETNVRGNTLFIETRGIHNLRNHLPVEVFITTPVLEGLNLSGSGIITTDYFITDRMDLSLSGSGNIETAFDSHDVKSVISGSGTLLISGISDNADFLISGSGKIDAYDLSLLNCEAKISGSGEMFLEVGRLLVASISGSGNIHYTGNPSVVTHYSGSGRVIKHNQ